MLGTIVDWNTVERKLVKKRQVFALLGKWERGVREWSLPLDENIWWATRIMIPRLVNVCWLD